MIPSREEELFVEFLRSRNLRVTAERRALLRAIFAQHRHIDAEEVLRTARAAGHKISRATVYRNLELLVECGLAHKVRPGDHRLVYEHVHPGQSHDHLACRRCGRIVEFISPGISALLAEICRAHAFEPRANQIQIVGVCRDCAAAAGAAAAPATATGGGAHG
ncbi:MAG: fur 1 [Acidobacteria bacterium]|jgi:Fur family ferric uptake transcriptional regulator|nr:fur 1 [Acidobacteriota bacterium]